MTDPNTRHQNATMGSRPSLAGLLLRGTFGRATGWVLVRVVGLGHALGG
ncbi:MAG: hypothetical protein H6744_15735 [Deltaproteobacteria bacterium]|nr:hypothetical protein [Deltaproteobacteria bacterium]MCB9788133.1 hypothetical protein [Deltaproteobacteria bacterium]